MIVQLRVDDRLIHGQVAVSWTAHLGADTIVVANDLASTDKLMQSAFRLAQPSQTTLSIKSVRGAILVINNPKYESRKIFVVCADPEDALRIAHECPAARSVCLGGVRQRGSRRRVSPQVFLDDEDMAAIEGLVDLGAQVTLQSVPDQSPLGIAAIRRSFGT